MGMYIPNMKSEQFYDLCKEHGLEIIAVPVQAHGRLIDADALFEEVYKVWGLEYDASACNTLMGFINEAPTIIHAEPCKEKGE